MFWDQLEPDDREAMLAAGMRRTYPAGSHLFLYGDEPTNVLVIFKGMVKMTRSSADGHEIMIEPRGEGYILGELAAIDSEPRNATITVVEDVEALVLTVDTFRNLLLERGSIAYALLTTVTDKLRQATDRRLEAGVGDTHARLCGRLVELAEDAAVGPDGVIEIKSALTQQELAEWIGVSRDAIVLALRRLRELGWVETGRRTIRILDLEALRRDAVE